MPTEAIAPPAPRPPDETNRLAALRQYDVLDSGPEQAYDDITRIASQVCGAPIAVVSLIDDQRQWFKSKTGLDAQETPRDVAFCAHAIMGQDLFVVPDATRDKRFSSNPLVMGGPGIRFYAGAPLINPDGHALGTLCVIDRASRELTPEQAEALRALGRQVVAQLELRRANSRMKLDLDAAARVQRSLLPVATPDVRGVSIAWSYRPSDELGGDMLGVFPLDERDLALYVLDASGHGVPAALLSVAAQRALAPVADQSSLVRTRVGRSEWEIAPPAGVAAGLNSRFPLEDLGGQYLTLLYGVLDAHNREFRFVSAGHPGPVLVPTRGNARGLIVSGLPIGFTGDAVYDEHRIRLEHGDRLYLYSDGLSEAANPHGEEFGTGRMVAGLQDARKLPLAESVDALVQAVEKWRGGELDDDATLVGVEILEPIDGPRTRP